jgi:hypothetical protein
LRNRAFGKTPFGEMPIGETPHLGFRRTAIRRISIRQINRVPKVLIIISSFPNTSLNLRASAYSCFLSEMIHAQGVVFFTAGFETTSNALTTLAFTLAKYPHIQAMI